MRGSLPSSSASPRRRWLIRPGFPPLASQGRLAELPPEHHSNLMPKRASMALISRDSSAMLVGSGAIPCWQPKLVPIPTSNKLGSAKVSTTIASRSAARTPSRKSPSSTINITPWRTPWQAAAAARALSTISSLLQLMAAWATTRSTWLSIGERIRSKGTPNSQRFRISIDSMRASPIECTPAATQVRAISGIPSVDLLTPVTLIPWFASRFTIVLALC